MRNCILILIFIHTLFLFPFLKPGIPLSHDGVGHVARMGTYYKALKDGQIPPRWAGDLNFRYGTPVFIFNYNLPYFAGTLFYTLGLNLEDSFKLMLGMAFILSGVGFFLWLSQIVSRNAAFVGALLFGLAPYHFLNVFVRGALGETIGLAIVPFIFWQIERMIKENKLSNIFLAGILYGFLILSHNGSAVIFSPVFLVYFIFRTKRKFQLVPIFTFFTIGFLISAYFWLPAILESKYVRGVSAIGEMYKQHFPPFSYLLYSNWGFGPDVNATNGLSPQVGIILFVFVFVATLKLFKHRDNTLGFWLVIFAVSIFLTTSLSNVIWSKITLLRILEFPWRFTALSSLTAAVIASLIINSIRNQKIVYLVIITLLLTSFLYTKTNVQNKKDDVYYYSYTGSTVYRGAASTIWSGGDPFKTPENRVEIISGNGQINNLLIKSNLHSFRVAATSDVKILDNTFYFRGWRVKIDGQKVPIEFQDIDHRGLITFYVPQGEHRVEVIFEESPIRFVSNVVSLIAIVGILFLFILLRVKVRV